MIHPWCYREWIKGLRYYLVFEQKGAFQAGLGQYGLAHSVSSFSFIFGLLQHTLCSAFCCSLWCLQRHFPPVFSTVLSAASLMFDSTFHCAFHLLNLKHSRLLYATPLYCFWPLPFATIGSQLLSPIREISG